MTPAQIWFDEIRTRLTERHGAQHAHEYIGKNVVVLLELMVHGLTPLQVLERTGMN